MSGSDLEHELVRFIRDLDVSDMPSAVVDRAAILLIDALANAVAGRSAQTTPLVERAVMATCGTGASQILAGPTASATASVFVNAHQITAYTMCDVYRPALCHITPEVVPPLLEASATRRVDGRTLLAAFAAGLEVTARLGLGIDYESFRARGWHAPGVIGPFGGVAAVSRVLGLDDDTTRGALGLALSQASGTFAALGTPAVKFHQARGAVAALWATRFAAAGLGGAHASLTHEDGGLLATYGAGGRPDAVVDGLGSRWELMEISLRRWPAASSLQSTVEASLDIVAQDNRVDPVAWGTLRLPPTPYAMCAEMSWNDELTAMQSARFVPATILRSGQCWVEQYDEAHRRDPDTVVLAERIEVVADPDLSPTGAVLTVETEAGATLTASRDVALGDPARPLHRRDVEEKLQQALGAARSLRDPDELWQRISRIDQVDNVGDEIEVLGDSTDEIGAD